MSSSAGYSVLPAEEGPPAAATPGYSATTVNVDGRTPGYSVSTVGSTNNAPPPPPHDIAPGAPPPQVSRQTRSGGSRFSSQTVRGVPASPYTGGSTYSRVTPVYYTEATLGEEPCEVFCPTCRKCAITRVEQVPGWLPWTICLTSCICFMLPLCCVFCGPCLMDKHHHCGNCNAFVGRRQACT